MLHCRRRCRRRRRGVTSGGPFTGFAGDLNRHSESVIRDKG